MNDSQLLGSNTAKQGFKNEKDIAKKFENWKVDEDAKQWLEIMKYNLDEIEQVKVEVLSNKFKSDIQVQVSVYLKKAISAENISIKLVSNSSGFNQIDKRWVDSYADMWEMDNDLATLLKLFTGEIVSGIQGQKQSRRMFINEFSFEDQNKLVNFFETNRLMVVSDLLRGRNRLTADWFMVAQKTEENQRWILKPISVVLNFFGGGEVRITNKGSLKIGRIGMQRKGGDNGRKSANMLQFKIDPMELLNS